MTYCLGENWPSYSINDSRFKFMESLDIVLLPTDYLYDFGIKIKQKYEWLFCYHRYREVLTEKTYKLFK